MWSIFTTKLEPILAKISLPTSKIQKQLVAEAEKEEGIISANRRLIELMEGKISQILSEI